MSTPQGAVAPTSSGQVVQGSVIEPTHSISPKTAAARSIANVLKTVVTSMHVYPSEGDMLNALRDIDSFAKAFADGELRHAVQEHDAAPVEDVSLRKPPAGAAPVPVPANMPQIDYAKLAAAMVAAQQAQREQETPTVHEITDAKPAQSETSATVTE